MLWGLVEEVMHKAVQQGAISMLLYFRDNLANVLTLYSFLFQSQTPLASPLLLTILPYYLMSLEANGTQTYIQSITSRYYFQITYDTRST